MAQSTTFNTRLVQPPGLAPKDGNEVRAQDRELSTPEPGKRKKRKQPLIGAVCLLTRGVLIRVGRKWSFFDATERNISSK
jgi:hypothetical protein